MSPKNNVKQMASAPWKRGHLHRIDLLPHGDETIASAITEYGDHIDTNRSSQRWAWTVQWIENILFGAGRHYTDDVLVNRLSANAEGENLSVVKETLDNIPRPVNDLLGRYVETNIALLTENRPIPRVTPKSEDIRDQKAAELSELTLQYLWEALNLPERHREIARLMLYCGVAWMEVVWDESTPRRMSIPKTVTEEYQFIQGADGIPVRVPVPRTVIERNEAGQAKMIDEVEYGDIVARIISPFEMHLPSVHEWDGEDMGWVMREYYVAIDEVISKYKLARKNSENTFTKKNGWFLENLEKVTSENVTKLPLWWWERLTALVEGPGDSLYVGSPEQWDGYAVVRVYDRKPNDMWPRGRSIMTIGNQLIYDSPKDKGARAYDPKFPSRWHPYIRFRWEAMPGSVYGRALVSKLLPKIKRVNAIDTTMIMYRRTVPQAAWIVPKGAHPQKDIWSGRPGLIWTYDPRQTAAQAPQPVQPPSYPEAISREREQQIQEMEFIAGTEEILRGQRPVGVSSAAAIDMLRKQALASRSAILQAWDESLQKEGSAFLQEVIKHVRGDERYLHRIKILAREKLSSLTIKNFTGEDLSDNVIVRIDTASMALLSKEAREAKAIEFLQYAGNLMQIPFGLQQAILDRLGYESALNPAGEDVERARRLIGWIKQGDFRRVIPFPEDDPFVFYGLLVKETKQDGFWDLDTQQQEMIWGLMMKYRQMIEARMAQQQMMQQQTAAAQAQAEGGGQGGGQQGGR